MTTKEIQKVNFSPQDFSREQLAIAVLVDRMSSLSKQSLSDLAQVATELARCGSREAFDEIAETIREIMFPELIGTLHIGTAGQAAGNGKQLSKWKEFIGEKIRELRKGANLTQEQLAENSGIPQSHISRIESGRHSPSHKTLTRIAKALGVSVGDLDPC
jgi:DNA-binding XRE family transcriptional regulator